MPKCYCLRFETPSTWGARFLYLYRPETGLPKYTPTHWVLFSSSPTTRRSTVKVFDPTSTRPSPWTKLWVKLDIKVMLLPTVSQPACHCVKHPWLKTRLLFCLTFAAPSLTRGRACLLQFTANLHFTCYDINVCKASVSPGSVQRIMPYLFSSFRLWILVAILLHEI
jgi:hypothetical protein